MFKKPMASAGFDRYISKLKSQWLRMKVSAGKSVASIKRASVATGNSVIIPELSAGDDLVLGMISYGFIEDDILTATIKMNSNLWKHQELQNI